jgi:hypothetical protein
MRSDKMLEFSPEWDFLACDTSLLSRYRCFEGTCCHFNHEDEDSMLHALSLMMKVECSSKISVYAYKTQQYHNPEDLNLKKKNMENSKCSSA